MNGMRGLLLCHLWDEQNTGWNHTEERKQEKQAAEAHFNSQKQQKV